MSVIARIKDEGIQSDVIDVDDELIFRKRFRENIFLGYVLVRNFHERVCL